MHFFQQYKVINGTHCLLFFFWFRLTGLRLQNIYDVNHKTFLLKFAKVLNMTFIINNIQIVNTSNNKKAELDTSIFLL